MDTPVTLAQITVSQSADFTDGGCLVAPAEGGAYLIGATVDGQMVSIPCAPRDLSGKALEAVIAPSFTYSSVIDRLSGDDIRIDGDPTSGRFAFNVAQARVAKWPGGAWVFVMRERTVASGALIDVMRGPFVVCPRPSF